MNKLAVITGCTGMDGANLAQYLLNQDYNVIGLARRTSLPNTARLKNIIDSPRFQLLTNDVCDGSGIFKIIKQYNPNELYHLAAMSHVGVSFNDPVTSVNIIVQGTINCLEAIRICSSTTKFYHAGSSEQFGSMCSYKIHEQYGERIYHDSKSYKGADYGPFQDEETPFRPNSPYAVGKLAAHELTRVYRDSYGLFAVSGILFNHEDVTRGEDFVTQKICKYIKNIGNHTSKLRLGNIETKRDFGYSKDYVRAMHLMLQQKKPVDYVIATGESHSVREFLDEAFGLLGITDWTPYVEINSPEFIRPNEVPFLLGDSSKARKALHWKPSVSFKQLVKIMITGENEASSK